MPTNTSVKDKNKYMNKFGLKWFLEGLLLGFCLRYIGQGYIDLVFVSKSIFSLSCWYLFAFPKARLKWKRYHHCAAAWSAHGSWPAKQPSAGRQQTTLLLYVLYSIPSKSKMWKHQLCASRQVDTKQDIKFFFNIIVHHLHTKRYGKTFFFWDILYRI